jgi:iron complex transport system ATP-binding protein
MEFGPESQGQALGPGRAEPWLRLSGLSFSFGARPVLEGVDLEFWPGRHYFLAGPNGAGKSTLLDLMARLKKPDRGQALLFGLPVEAYPPPRMARLLALAPQSYRLNFGFTVREFVSLGRRPYLGRWGRLGPGDWEEVDRAIGLLNLFPLAHKPVTALSGGETHRAVLARTLAQRTPIILLDEPTAGLDVAQALDLMTALAGLCRSGSLIITVTHDLSLASAFAQEIVFLKSGRLAAAGPLGQTMTPEVLERVFEARAMVRPDPFSGGLSLSFRPL